VFTNAPVTTENQTFQPFVDETPAGVSLEVDNCIPGTPPRKLPILYVGPAGPGTQVNVYFPNDIGTEPYGPCASPPVSAVLSNFTLRTAYGTTITKRLSNHPIYPGIKYAGAAVGNPPDGWHLDRRSGAYTPFTVCDIDPARCPVTSGGQPNLLVLLTTGGELRSCNAPGFASCDSDLVPRFRLAAVTDGQIGSPVVQSLAYYGPTGFGSLGEEQANVVLRPDTQPGEYRVSMTVPGLPNQTPQQQIRVRLGPGV
jgi:hypothetical protein